MDTPRLKDAGSGGKTFFADVQMPLGQSLPGEAGV